MPMLAEGYEQLIRELKALREERPRIVEAIEEARAHGDLSENAEWEAAIEEQRTLTGRAMEMQTELSKVELIENAILPEDMACPGTVVRYKDAGKSREQEIVILGPWDTDLAENVVSYRAPLAAGLLGKRPGEKAKITLPSGTLDVEVIATKPFTLDH